MSAPTLVSFLAGSTVGTTNVTIAAAAGDLCVFIVENNDATVTATIGATSAIAADVLADNGTIRTRIFSKVLVSGDISGGNVTATASSHTSGGSRRVAGYVFRHANGWAATPLSGTATNTTASGTSVTLNATAPTQPCVAVVGSYLVSTVQAQTAAWDSGTARASDYNGATATVSSFLAKPNNAGTEAGYDTNGARTQSSVVITPYGNTQQRAVALAVYQTLAVTIQRSAFRSTSATGRSFTPHNQVTQRSSMRTPSSSLSRATTSLRVLTNLRASSASRSTAPLKTLVSVPVRSAFRSVTAALGRFTPDNLRNTVQVGRRGSSSIATASPLVRSSSGFRSTSATGGGRATPHVYRQRVTTRSALASKSRFASLVFSYPRVTVRSASSSSSKAVPHGITHPTFRSSSASRVVITSHTVAYLLFRSVSGAVVRGVTKLRSKSGFRSASSAASRARTVNVEPPRDLVWMVGEPEPGWHADQPLIGSWRVEQPSSKWQTGSPTQ